MPIVLSGTTTTTVNDIIHRAGLALAYLGRGETMSAQDAVDALACFNEMLNSWSNEDWYTYATLQRTLTLTAGTSQYSIGDGGDVDSTRPHNIVQAFLRDSNSNDYPVNIIPQAQWNMIGDKGITSQIPDTLFYDAQYPLGYINLFPVPMGSGTLYFDSTLDQVTYSLLTTVIEMPVGYVAAYVYNLALQLMTFGFPCMLDDKGYIRLVENASQAIANIKRSNIKEVKAEYDPAIIAKSAATYNVYSDSFPRVT